MAEEARMHNKERAGPADLPQVGQAQAKDLHTN